MARTTTAALAGLLTLGAVSACSQTTSDTAPADAAAQGTSSTTSADATAPADTTGSTATTGSTTTGTTTGTTATGQTGTTAQQGAPAASGPVPATQADVTTGAAVSDINGTPIGTLETVDATGAVLNANGQRVKLPIASFGKTATGLVIGTTKADFDAQVAASKSTQPGAAPGGTSAPATPPPAGSGTSTPPQ